jgi:hypothetical protein
MRGSSPRMTDDGEGVQRQEFIEKFQTVLLG